MPIDDPIEEARRQWLAHGWETAADGMAMVTSITRVHQLLMERIDGVLRGYNLTFARFEILRVLAFTKQGALPMSKLGTRLQVHAATITSTVGRLQDQGYVSRAPSEADGRVVLAGITQKGREVVEKVTVDLNEAVFARPGLPAREVDELIRLLRTFRIIAGDAPDARGGR